MAEARRGHAILCAGIAVQDIMMRVDEFPAPGTKVSASDFIVTGGGCAANAAVAAARLGARAGFSGPLGDDEVSDRIIADLGRGHVDCAGVVRVKGATASVSLILIDAAGEKSIATRRGGPPIRLCWYLQPTPCSWITVFPNSSRRFVRPPARAAFLS